jgi:hypothetical protein
MKKFNFRHLPNWIALAALISLTLTNIGLECLPKNYGNIVTIFFSLLVGLGIFSEGDKNKK